MPEAMKLVRGELGNDAIILNTRVIQTGGFLGFFKKRSIEVVAALDTQLTQPMITVPKEKQKHVEPSTTFHDTEKVEYEQMLSIDLQEELSELKSLLKNNTLLSSQEGTEGIPLPAPIGQVKQLFAKQELSPMMINEIVNSLIEVWYTQGGNLSYDQVLSISKEQLIKRISHLPFGGITFTKKYINIVGPTGVGKTTTLAKIAASCILTYKKKVAFITTDTYRIAAIDQLKTYGDILKIPVEVCYSLEDFRLAMKKFENFDLVFIDTAGRNFRNPKYVEDLKKIIDFNQEMETLLVLSLTSKQTDMEEIIQQFSSIDINKIIFTKADETSTYGAMYNIIKNENKAAAYITNGQNVPDDLVVVNPEKIVDFIVGAD